MSPTSSELKQLTKELQLQNSFKHRFLVGIVQGIGSALGATFVASLVFLIVGNVLISTAKRIPSLQIFIDKLLFEENFARD